MHRLTNQAAPATPNRQHTTEFSSSGNPRVKLWEGDSPRFPTGFPLIKAIFHKRAEATRAAMRDQPKALRERYTWSVAGTCKNCGQSLHSDLSRLHGLCGPCRWGEEATHIPDWKRLIPVERTPDVPKEPSN